jgi:hypothetical protein
MRQFEKNAEKEEHEHLLAIHEWSKKIEDQNQLINKMVDMQMNIELKIEQAQT